MKIFTSDSGLKRSVELFLQEATFCFRRAHCCSYSEVTIYVPRFIFSPSGSSHIRSWYYGQKIVVEMRLENMLAQMLITLGHVTDFTNPVHTTNRHKVDLCFQDRTHLRTENYTLAMSQAHKFLLCIMPQLHSRILNVITVSPGAVSSLIHSFESTDDPRGAFSRVFLANM